MSVSKYVRDTIWAYLQANWSETRVIDTLNQYQNDAVQGSPLTEWVTMTEDYGLEQQASIGAPNNQRWREEGALVFTAFVPSGTGVDRALELAEMLRDLFRGKQITDGAGGETITFRGVDPPDTTLPSAVQGSAGAWFGYSVGALYYVDYCRDTS